MTTSIASLVNSDKKKKRPALFSGVARVAAPYAVRASATLVLI